MEFIQKLYYGDSHKSTIEIYYDWFMSLRTDTGSSLHYDIVLGFFATIVCISCIDFIFVNRIFDRSVRYFVLHSIFNAWVTFTVFNDAIYALLNPIEVFQQPYASSAIQTTAGIAAFHLYHLVVFSDLTFEDWVHHIVNSFFVPIIGVMLPMGKVISLSNLGMCGLPGGLDYIMLVVVKTGKMTSLLEKRINRYLHLLIRLPIQLLLDYIFICNYLKGTVNHFSKLTCLFVVLAMIAQTGNGIYYTVKVIENYAIKKYIDV